jgi:hypothetical protein
VRARGINVAALASGVMPAALVLALLQRAMYGSPVASGYGAAAFSDFFSLANIAPNVHDYGHRLLAGEGPALSLLALSALFLFVTRARRPMAAVPARASVLCALFIAVIVACYLPYGVFAEWWYLRFLLPALAALFVLAGIIAAAALTRFPPASRGITTALALTVACATNVVLARGQQAFVLRVGEARYQQAGRYLDAMLPRNAVVITSQQSASVHVYTGLPVFRWDLFAGDFDRAVRDLTTDGRRPVLLVEDWERPQVAARFPSSTVARLDWTPQADFGDPVRVGLYDPAQRGHAIVTDRVH